MASDENHERTAPGWFCHNHNALFEFHEAAENGGACPWCGGVVVADGGALDGD